VAGAGGLGNGRGGVALVQAITEVYVGIREDALIVVINHSLLRTIFLTRS
jgi:hypothetical protein